MNHRFGLGYLLALSLFAATPVLSQETAPVADTPAEDAGSQLSAGEPVSNERKVGDVYVSEEVGDWEIRCVHVETGEDPCQLYQLLLDPNGSPTAEFTLFRVTGDQFAAGATVLTPLETLLTRGITFSVGQGLPKRYPFNVCTGTGCVAQVGFTAEEVQQMMRGLSAKVVIVPYRAQRTEFDLSLSLKGFTDGYNKLVPRPFNQ